MCRNNEQERQPLRAYGEGVHMGLTLLLDAEISEWALPSSAFYGFKARWMTEMSLVSCCRSLNLIHTYHTLVSRCWFTTQKTNPIHPPKVLPCRLAVKVQYFLYTVSNAIINNTRSAWCATVRYMRIPCLGNIQLTSLLHVLLFKCLPACPLRPFSVRKAYVICPLMPATVATATKITSSTLPGTRKATATWSTWQTL